MHRCCQSPLRYKLGVDCVTSDSQRVANAFVQHIAMNFVSGLSARGFLCCPAVWVKLRCSVPSLARSILRRSTGPPIDEKARTAVLSFSSETPIQGLSGLEPRLQP